MYTLIVILSMVFGHQTAVVTVSLDNIADLQDCQDIGLSVRMDFPDFDLEEMVCAPQDWEQS